MSNDLIDYAKMLDNAMRSVLRQALDCATDEGLPGSHNLYITFATKKVGVDIPASLIAQYPEEMTIVLEHKFWNLSTTDDGFSVTLSFNGKYEKLYQRQIRSNLKHSIKAYALQKKVHRKFVKGSGRARLSSARRAYKTC